MSTFPQAGGSFLFVAMAIQNCPWLSREVKELLLGLAALGWFAYWTFAPIWLVNSLSYIFNDTLLAISYYWFQALLGVILWMAFFIWFTQPREQNLGEINRPGWKVGW